MLLKTVKNNMTSSMKEIDISVSEGYLTYESCPYETVL